MQCASKSSSFLPPASLSNRYQYVECVRRLRLRELTNSSRMAAICVGMATVLPRQLLCLMSPHDMELRTSGLPTVDLTFLKVLSASPFPTTTVHITSTHNPTPSIHFTWPHIPLPVFTLHSFTPHHQCPLYVATHPLPASTLHSHTPHHQCLLYRHTPHRQHPLYIATHHTTSVCFTYPHSPLPVLTLHHHPPTTSVHFT